LGSKMYSSIVSCECSVSLTLESSKNVIAIRPLDVIASSFCCMSKDSVAWYGLSLTTCAEPVSSDILPTSTASCCSAVVLNDANSTVTASRVNL
jgi:hypothetical protein